MKILGARRNKIGNQLIRTVSTNFFLMEMHVTDTTAREYRRNENEEPIATLLILLPSTLTQIMDRARFKRHTKAVLDNSLKLSFRILNTLE